MKCLNCNSNMIKRYSGVVYATYPPQRPWIWWCACGTTAAGGVETDQTEEDAAKEAWNKANLDPEPDPS